MRQFEDEHEKAFPGTKVDKVGQPDQGNGWYCRQLPLEKWVKFQSAQRVVMNYVEWMPIIIIYTLVAGLVFPQVVIYTSWIIVVGRLLYCIGYIKAPHLRVPGFMVQLLCIFTNLILSFASVAMMCMSQRKTADAVTPTQALV